MLRKTKVEFVTESGLKFVKETNEMGLENFSIDGKEVDNWELTHIDKSQEYLLFEIKVNFTKHVDATRKV